MKNEKLNINSNGTFSKVSWFKKEKLNLALLEMFRYLLVSTKGEHGMKTTRVLVLALVFALAISGSAFAREFHIVAMADTLADETAEAFVGSAVSSVTRDLGAPSMVRDNLSHQDRVDYIFVGDAQVLTFEVMRESKEVMAYHKDDRAGWEAGVFPGYPE